MVARGDAVLVGMLGFMALYLWASATLLSSVRPSPLWLTVLIGGIGLLVVSIILYLGAERFPWTPLPEAERPMVTLACPVFGTPLAWVDEVGQWYCPHCKAYHGATPA